MQPCVFDAPKCTKVLERAAKSAGCVLSEIFTEFTELIDISRSRVKIMLEVVVGGVEQRLGNLALGPEL